jgi:MraZ protein
VPTWFTGRFERQLDNKNRVALPAEFRRHFGESCVLALGSTGCIEVFTQERFDEMAQKLLDKLDAGEVDADEVRVFSSSIRQPTFDGQGRIILDQSFREYAGIADGDRLVVNGRLDRLEIWESSAFEPIEARGTQARKNR